MRICLIGKNLTNVLLANVLANKNIAVDIVYDYDLSKIDSIRTLAISNDNLNYIKKVTKKNKITSWSSKKIKIYVEKSEKKELLKFENKYKNIFNLVKYKEIYDFFLNNIKNNHYITFTKIKKKNLYLNLQEKKYNLIINSDSKSNFNNKFFYRNIKKDYNSIAYTSIISHEKTINDYAVQIFTKFGPIAFLPLSKKETSIVFSYNGKKKINEMNVMKIIKKYNTNYKILNFSRFEKFIIKFSMLRNYYFKNILLFGDLIHKIHPLAGQGFNMIIRDIKILSKLIDEKNDLGLEINASVASEFEKKTKHLNYLYGSGIDFIYEFFKLDNKFNNFISKPVFNVLNKSNFLNKYATRFSDKGLEI